MKKVKVDVQKLFDTGAHLGHQTKRWDPKISSYLYGSREGIHIFDLEKTQIALEEALEVLEKAVTAKKKVLVVGTKSQAKDAVEKFGKKTGVMYVSERWLGGTMTNIEQIRKSLRKMDDLEGVISRKDYGDLTKFERLQLKREAEKLERMFGGVRDLIDGLPELVIIIDTKREHAAVAEAALLGVETIGIVDTNADPADVDWPVPMNDDSTSSVKYVLKLFEEVVVGSRASKVKSKKTKKKVAKSPRGKKSKKAKKKK